VRLRTIATYHDLPRGCYMREQAGGPRS